MKVLMTGCTPMHVGSTRTEGEYSSSWRFLRNIVTELGHSVTSREVVPGEDLSQFDVALVGLHAVNGMQTARYKHGALWAIHATKRHLLVINDGKFDDIRRSFQYQQAYWKVEHLGKSHSDRLRVASRYSEEIESVRKRLADGFDRVLMPFFAWGDRSPIAKTHPIGELITWDPTPFVPYVLEPDEVPMFFRKDKAWSIAALQNLDWFTSSLGLSWPVVGPHKPWTIAGRPAGQTDWKIPERDVVKLYANNAGHLAFPYGKPMVGTGWWRSRLVYASIQCYSVVWSTPEEYGCLGADFSMPVRSVEAMDWVQLEALAARQREILLKYASTRERELDNIRGILSRI